MCVNIFFACRFLKINFTLNLYYLVSESPPRDCGDCGFVVELRESLYAMQSSFAEFARGQRRSQPEGMLYN